MQEDILISPERCALLMIDMQGGFIEESSSLCVSGAKATIEACGRALDIARKRGVLIYHVNRRYAIDGSDVEPVRRELWEQGGKPLSAAQPTSLEAPDRLKALEGEHVLIKPRFSAFFDTSLDDDLRERNVNTVILAGTTTPNCIRTTCYDALSLNYDVVIVEDATSSRSSEVQKANIEDMRFIGAHITCSAELEGLLEG